MITIRPATSSDRQAIDRFGARAIHDTYDSLVDVAHAHVMLARWWGDALDAPIGDGEVTVAVEADDVVGLAHVGISNGDPVLWKLYVATGRRDRGLGRRLIESVIAELAPATSSLRTEHIAANVRAARFYERAGFLSDGFEPADDARVATIWRTKHLDGAATDPDGVAASHHHDDIDWSAMGAFLSAWDDVAEQRHRAVVRWLEVAPGDVVVDVGAGAGGMTSELAAAVGIDGTAIAVDGSAELLVIACDRAHRRGHQVQSVAADLERDDLHEVLGRSPVDLVHASAVMHHLDDEVAGVRRLAAAVRPGGRVVVAEGGLPGRFLPADCGIGDPGLEARLEAAQQSWFWGEVRPTGATVRTGQGWGEVLAAAGLTHVVAKSFLLDVPPPLGPPERALVRGLLAARAERVADRLDPADRATLATLLDSDHPAGVMRRADVSILDVCTVHVGTVPA